MKMRLNAFVNQLNINNLSNQSVQLKGIEALLKPLISYIIHED